MADIEHVDIPDGKRHEVKGADAALTDQLLFSNGDGTTEFRDFPSLAVEMSDGVSTESTSEQTLATVGNELKINFSGVEVNSPSGSITIQDDGDVVFNQDGVYILTVSGNVSRSTSTGSATVGFSYRLNGTQVGSTAGTSVDTAGSSVNGGLSATSVVPFTAGDVISLHMILLDNTGGGVVGLYPKAAPYVGWNDIPSVYLAVRQLGVS